MSEDPLAIIIIIVFFLILIIFLVIYTILNVNELKRNTAYKKLNKENSTDYSTNSITEDNLLDTNNADVSDQIINKNNEAKASKKVKKVSDIIEDDVDEITRSEIKFDDDETVSYQLTFNSNIKPIIYEEAEFFDKLSFDAMIKKLKVFISKNANILESMLSEENSIELSNLDYFLNSKHKVIILFIFRN